MDPKHFVATRDLLLKLDEEQRAKVSFLAAESATETADPEENPEDFWSEYWDTVHFYCNDGSDDIDDDFANSTGDIT